VSSLLLLILAIFCFSDVEGRNCWEFWENYVEQRSALDAHVIVLQLYKKGQAKAHVIESSEGSFWRQKLYGPRTNLGFGFGGDLDPHLIPSPGHDIEYLALGEMVRRSVISQADMDSYLQTGEAFRRRWPRSTYVLGYPKAAPVRRGDLQMKVIRTEHPSSIVKLVSGQDLVFENSAEHGTFQSLDLPS